MSLRAARKSTDIQQCIYQLLAAKAAATSPWTSWTVVLGWPEDDVFKRFSKPVLYVEAPLCNGDFNQQGGAGYERYSMIIGAWCDRKTGGEEEMNIITDTTLNLFKDPKTLQSTSTFNVTTSTAYTGTTLTAQGIVVQQINGPRVLTAEDPKEFRREFEVILIA
ncbi:MAG: hypothetical protein PHX83_12055 [Acidobacteriia bacterium]|nr:hypothetical protein [Terriglobia bacterium]